jgi:topoisomerase-4 subunit A
MRYTEARLTAVAKALLEGIDEDAVDFRATYDASEEEPVVLPGRFPNLLANGSSGIAVGMATSIPPHNVGELCDALLHLIKFPRATIAKLTEFIPGPDFPTGGVLAENVETVREAYATGRGSFRLRARWTNESLGRGTWQIVVSEIPFQVQKSRLIEKIAEQLNEKRLPLLADIRDESADDVRIVLEPRSRSVEPVHLMEMMFRSTDLEARIPLNMNVLEGGRTPRVMNLREVLQAFLDHRHDVLQRRSRFRLAKIEERLEVLDGYLIAYLNLDKVIRIIRDNDDPKPKLIKAFKLTDNQAEAILNMRLRALRKLEEMEIRSEHEKLSAERRELNRLLKDAERRWAAIGEEIRLTRKEFGPTAANGKRRTELGKAPAEIEVPLDALVEKEPITVVCSAMGWIRALKGHGEPSDDVKYKEGDQGRFWLKAETTDKILVFASNGRFYTLSGDKLPSGRGHGEPVRLMVDLPNEAQIVHLLVHKPGRKLVVAASDGRGFAVVEDQVVAQTRAGKQVLNVKDAVKAAACAPIEGDSLALIGQNRKLLVIPVAEIPELGRGRGVRLQRYRDGGLSDIKSFDRKDGLSWTNAGRTFAETALAPWAGSRGQAGRLPPKGFPKSNRFSS